MTFVINPRHMTHILVPGIVVTEPLAISAAETIIEDSFTDVAGTQLRYHTPDVNTPGNPWHGGEQSLWTIAPSGITAQYTWSLGTYAKIDTGVTDYTVTGIVRFDNSASGVVRGIHVRANTLTGAAANRWNTGYHITIGMLVSAGPTWTFQIHEVDASGGNIRDSTVVAGFDHSIEHTIVAICSGSSITATLDGGNTLTYNSAPTTGRPSVGMQFRRNEAQNEYITNIVVTA